MWRTRESMSIVSIYIIVPLSTTNSFWFKVLLDEIPENIQKWFLIYVGMPSMWNNALCSVITAHNSNACASSRLVTRSTIELVPWETCQEDYSLHPQLEKGCCYYEKDRRVQNTHLNMWSKRKGRTRNLSRILWHYTRLSSKSTASDSNKVGLTPNLVTSFLA
jgi:hypothetical protein